MFYERFLQSIDVCQRGTGMKKIMKKHYKKFNMLILWAALCVIFILAVVPVNYAPETGLSDKLNHAAAFFALSILALHIYPGTYFRSGLWLMLYGIAIEGIQIMVPGRSCSLLDLAANLIGIAAGSMLIKIYDHSCKKGNKKIS